MDNEPDDKETTPSHEGAPAPGPATTADLEAALGAPSEAAPGMRVEHDDAAEQRRRVNDGRLKKTSDELAAANARIAELEARLAKAGEAETRFDADAVKKLARDPSDVDDAFAETTAAGLNAVRDQVRKEMKGEFDAMRAEMTASREAAAAAETRRNLERTLKEVEGIAPGLVVRIARGDLRDRWNSFLDGTDPFSGASLRGILQGAVRGGRTDAAKEVYARFVRDAGLSGQYGGVVTAPPRSAAPVVPRGAGNGKVYGSIGEIVAMQQKALRDFSDGLIDRKTRDAILKEADDARFGRRYLR